jgi:hypothetical protein
LQLFACVAGAVHRSTAALSNPILPLLFSCFVLAISPLLRLSLLRVTLRSFPATKTPASFTFVQLEETQRHAPTGSSEQFAARYACAATFSGSSGDASSTTRTA